MNDGDADEQVEVTPTPEPFIVKGDILSIQNLTISLGADGKLEAQPVSLYTGSHMCPQWLKIAYDHLLVTEENSNTLLDAIRRSDDEAIGDALKLEFSSGMQAVMASGIAIDAFFAAVKEHVVIPPATTQAWRTNGTARYKQISEVFRLAFRLDNTEVQELRNTIKRIYYFRDRAVHPSSTASALAIHPQLNKMTNWWYAAFCYQNAKTAASFAIQIICRLAGSPNDKDYVSPSLTNYCKASLIGIIPLLAAWEEHYGPLITTNRSS